ncbi:LPXTG cell wall anchor domain-containing protein [Enterococcus sp. OL5]|uniref:LPXTG cell wall anchor domain-containing protein n=1 Tax=Enterococcus sp. OL5 TaxID=2590214 RepID=UPI001129F88B|nr:LPXTG cell wall anchor domain-containing protein [Enterococcus sp. OL5]TPR55074.1 LPXTG cell wall anchor domain-containing protein [Enterococcus sp. OL5]
MRKKILVWLMGLNILGSCLIDNTPIVQATTYENQAVVSFYQCEEVEHPEIKVPESSNTLPKTGSSFSFMGIVGMFVLLLAWWLKKFKKRKMNTRIRKRFLDQKIKSD